MSINGRLLNWVDVARGLWKASQPVMVDEDLPSPPRGVVFARAYWDRLLVGVEPDTDKGLVHAWFKDLFGPRWYEEDSGPILILEGQGEDLSRLPIEFEELSPDEVQEWRETPFQPRFMPPRTTHFIQGHRPEPLPFSQDQPPLLAFHSFKGGVGRTLCALATALAYVAHGRKILLVDADFEAPGISFLFESRRPDSDFALADLLTMLHADSDPNGSNALASARAGVVSQRLGDIFVLPSFRQLEDSVSLEIRPEHLVASTAHSPFFLGDILSRLGKELGVDLVIVDLRAGLSELSAPLILDPRIKRILVTNLSGQSLKGTRFLIRAMGRVLKTNQWRGDNLPALILNQLPATIKPGLGMNDRNEWLESVLERINVTLEQAFSDLQTADSDGSEISEEGSTISLTNAEEGIALAMLPYIEPLALLADDWEKAVEEIGKSSIPNAIWEKLQLWLPAIAIHPSTVEMDAEAGLHRPSTLDERRTKLRDFAEKLVTAEGTSDGSMRGVDFLPIAPLANLARDHTAKLPVVVSVGAKGAGKTYSFLSMVRSQQWAEFVRKVGSTWEGGEVPMLPILWSKNADSEEMGARQRACGTQLGLPVVTGTVSFELPVALSRFQGGASDVYAWRSFWLNAIARSLGVTASQTVEPIEALLAYLRQQGQSLVAVIDGLEEAFPEFSTSSIQQTALRALLQEVPNWLRSLPGLPLGLIVFVRQDMVLHAIPQNRAQFTDRFKSYALKWTWKEALELAAWVCDKSAATQALWSAGFAALSDVQQVEKLQPLWGKKLGGDHTNEAISNNWVLSVLSDLRGRIQARDVVRFLSLAAQESVGNSKTTDRILAPVAMRQAIQSCSRKKVDEMGEENAPLEVVFAKIKGYATASSSINSPCSFEDLARLGLDKGQVELMEENGVIFLESEDKIYHFPEIFRNGLGISRPAGARPKVVSLLRQARNQGRF